MVVILDRLLGSLWDEDNHNIAWSWCKLESTYQEYLP